MDHEKVQSEMDQMAARLQEDGLAPGAASAEECQRHLWHRLVAREEELRTATQELEALRSQQASEMKEVESYVEHIRGLLVERESLSADYEKDNEHLRLELQHVLLQQENQGKELAELFAQEGLVEMDLSGPSEQVAYLLVERTTLLERLEAAERRLDTQSLTGSLREVHLQEELDHLRHSMGKELRQQRDETVKSKDDMAKAHSEEMYRERQRLERDLEEASGRLAMAHLDIRRLTSELDAARSNNLGVSGPELELTGQEVENLRREVDKLKNCDMVERQRAREQNERLDGEIRALRERVRTLDAEKKSLQDMLSKSEPDARTEREVKEKQGTHLPEELNLHKRCLEAVEDGLVQVRELQRRLQRQRADQEELVERNEELEALLGEAQNAGKEERQRHEGELEGLHRRIKSLEAELKKQPELKKHLKNGEEVKETESYIHQLRGSSQERVSLLEARLTEEKEWRKQLEVDLSAAQAALKKDKEALQMGERERKKMRLEVNSLMTECQQGKTLIKSLTQVKGEKAALEEKVAQLLRAQSRLQGELEHHKEGGGAQEDLRESREQVERLKGQADKMAAELSSLQTEHDKLREEVACERLRSGELQAQLSASVQEGLGAAGERERLSLEVQRLQERLSSGQEGLPAGSGPDPRLAPDNSTEQRPSTEQDLGRVQATLEERRISEQHQQALQALVQEAQARAKSQDSVISQKTEEARQLKQDVQRAQNLFTSAERELRYEREKNLDLKRHNALLDQEKLKLCAELKQTQGRLAQAEHSVQAQGAECERQQQRLRELELELARTATSRSTTAGLQEELQAERARVIAGDKKVVELQQQLKSAQHQLRVEEARSGESGRLERDSRDLSDALSALRAQQQEEHITRKLLEQRGEELQQQVRSLRQREASLGKSNAELGHRAQQLEARLAALEVELCKAREEERDSQRVCARLQEDLAASQQDCDRLQTELQQVLLQMDSHIRKYNEKQSQHKAKLRQAKLVFLQATAQRDRTIQRLEGELALASSLAHKEKEWLRTVMGENEKLLAERRELLRRMSEAEDMGNSGMRTASTVQHRVNVLEIENRQLQEKTLKLSNQVTSLERAVRNVQSFYSMEDVKKTYSSECHPGDSVLHASTLSVTSGMCDPLGILDALCRVKVAERPAEGSSGTFLLPNPKLQPSELGYLNLTSPLAPQVAGGEEEGPAGDKVG